MAYSGNIEKEEIMTKAFKSRLRRYYKQRGRSVLHADVVRLAKRVGWRKSSSGHWYFENRRNRSDRSKRRRL